MEARVVFKNTMALSIATILARAISAIVGIFVTRYLGPTSAGEYTIALTYVSTVLLFTDFGMGQLMVQDGSRDPDKLPVYLGNTLIFRIILITGVNIASYFIAKPLGYNMNIQTMVLIFGVANGLAALNNMIYNYFQARQEMYIAAIYQFLSTFFIGIGTIFVLVKRWGVIQISMVQLVVLAVITVLLYLAVVKKNPLRVDWSKMGTMVRGGLPFGISYLFYYIYFQIASFMLSLMRTTAEVGTYSAAYRLISVLLFIPGIFTSVLYPILYQLGVGNMETHKQTVEKIFKFLTAIGLPVSILFFLLADPIISFLYGNKFADAGLALKLLAWFFALEAMSFTIGDVLTTTNNQWTRTWIQGSAALGNIILNYFMIKAWGIYGSSVATLITELYILFAYLFAVRKKVYDINIVKQLPGVLLANAGLSAVVLLLPHVNFFIAALLGGVVYLILLDRLDKDVHYVIRYILTRLKLVRVQHDS